MATQPIHAFDLSVSIPGLKPMSDEFMASIDRELDFRQPTRIGVLDPVNSTPKIYAGSTTCGNSCGVLTIGCGNSGCGNATCQCTLNCFSDGCNASDVCYTDVNC